VASTFPGSLHNSFFWLESIGLSIDSRRLVNKVRRQERKLIGNATPILSFNAFNIIEYDNKECLH
jgi:hypothetical protein